MPTEPASAEEGEAERWESAFESPDDLWMRFLARAEEEGGAGLEVAEEWLTREQITIVAEREWQLLLGSRPTPDD